MISIEGKTGIYTIYLDDSNEFHQELTVESKIENENITWVISFISDPDLLSVNAFGNSKLSIDTNPMRIKNDELIMLKNVKDETISIIVKPSMED